MPISPTLPQAVGTFLGDFRKEHDLTLDQIARSARDFGASWSASSVRNIENGKAVTSLQNLLALALALNHLTEVELTLSDLLGGATSIEGPTPLGMPVKREWIDSVLNGGPIAVGQVTNLVGGEKRLQQTIEELPERLKKMSAELPEGGDLRIMGKVPNRDREATLAEERAAQKLKINPASLRVWSWHLWGKDLEDEAAERASERASVTGKAVTAQSRGAMTRALVREIEEARIHDATKVAERRRSKNG